MASRDEATLPATRRPKTRKSIASIPQTDQENMTADLGALSGKRPALGEKAKKSRSKSIGPGGLDALTDSTGNRRKSLSLISNPPPKSILKPTMPPLREIPAHISARSPKKSTPPTSIPPTPPAPNQNLLIDFSLDPPSGPTVTGGESLPNPFQIESNAAVNETRVTLRTEEEQQAAAREREEKEREKLEKEINSRRDARRKSLANRRVSFAPEATLHTWDVVVEYQDSTTSSAATNSTRRASSAAGTEPGTPQSRPSDFLSSDPSEPPSTPPEQVEEDTVVASPAHQRDLHQKSRRRSSGIPPMNFNNPDEALSSSPYSGDSDEDGDVPEDVEDDGSESNSDNDDDDGTAMSLDGNTTDMSMASVKSASSTGSSTRLEEALQAAARQAGTQGIDFDEHGDTPMSEDEEVVASFAPWAKKTAVTNLESQQDQENVNPFSPAFKAVVPEKEDNNSEGEEMTMDMTSAVGGIIPPQEQQDDEMSMDVTRAFGGIITNGIPKKPESSRKSMPSTRRQSTRRRSSESSSSLGDETMDMTMAVGGIMPPRAQEEDQSNDDEDMTMEFTSVVGGVLPQGNGLSNKNRRRSSMAAAQKKRSRESLESTAGDETMDMTMAMGGIMPSISESAPDELDTTMGMEMTTALGGILQPQLSTGNRSHAKKMMELETDFGSSPFQVDPISPPKSVVPQLTVAMASETGSPSLAAFRGKSLRRSADARKSTMPKSKLNEGTPVKNPTTPSKQLTPQPERPTTPGKTPPSKSIVMRTSSPKRLFKGEIKAASTTPQSALPKKLATPNRLFQKDMTTGVATPNVVLTPQRRISSGIGFDREGLGSPRVAAILDRRQSIGDQARPFVPSGLEDSARGVRSQSPRAMEEEVDKERQQEEDRENGRKILEREADQGQDDKDSTLNLKEMIQSMTPKKKSLKGRKSLHVGAAKGILGKRPAELDEEEEEEDDGGVKRLKGHQGSPVKNIRLPAPPSKAETTTGRLTRAARKSLQDVSTTINTPTTSSSPTKDGKVTTPHGQGRFKDAEANASPEKIAPLGGKEPVEEPEIDEESFGDERIQLQDFLNMTSIRFMELTTTKRRHTIAPKRNSLMGDIHGKPSTEDAVATGASTIPMLELFQHQCRELKTYISEGRRTIREIENTTFEENPPLFREYISAPHDVKLGMDNQLKNVKTHARLLSKGTWYEWRMKLLRTLLDDGLFKIADGMVKDEELLDHQQALLDSVLPKLVETNSKLAAEEANLLSVAEELANCDPAELADARDQLIAVDADIEAKERRIADLRRQLQGTEVEIEAGILRKQTCLDDIREAEKVREECRGWSSNEIVALKAKVDKLEQEYGWTITGVSGTTTSMTYRKEIELVFDAASFRSTDGVAAESANSRIDLWYIAASRQPKPLPLTAEKDFFLQNIRDHIRGLPQSETPVKDLLHAVSVAWNKANAVVDDIHLLNLNCPTVLTKTSDNSIRIKSNLMLVPLATKVEITFELVSHSVNSSIDVEICPSATVVYGERFNEPKMREFLLNRLGNRVQEKGGEVRESWGGAVAELAEKLLARGRK